MNLFWSGQTLCQSFSYLKHSINLVTSLTRPDFSVWPVAVRINGFPLYYKMISMGLTVNRQMAKKSTLNRQKRNIFTVNCETSEPKLAVKFLF